MDKKSLFNKKYVIFYILLIVIIITVLIVFWEYIVCLMMIGLFIYYYFKDDNKKQIIDQYGGKDIDISVTDTMSGVEFEIYLSNIFKRKGYQVTTTPTSNDYGADLILKKNGEVTVVQAKRYKDKVGVGAVQEVNAAIPYYRAHKGMVITNSYFTANAKSLAQVNRIQLIDRDKLSNLIHE